MKYSKVDFTTNLNYGRKIVSEMGLSFFLSFWCNVLGVVNRSQQTAAAPLCVSHIELAEVFPQMDQKVWDTIGLISHPYRAEWLPGNQEVTTYILQMDKKAEMMVRNIKTPSYQCKDSHDNDKTVWRPSYLCNGNHHTWKDSIYIDTVPRYHIDDFSARHLQCLSKGATTGLH